MGAGAEVFVRGGRLRLRFLSPVPGLYSGFELHPADENDPYAFRVDFSQFGMGRFPLVFSREPATGTTAIHLGLMPVSLDKRPVMTDSRRWVTGAVTVGTTALAIRSLLGPRRPRGTTRCCRRAVQPAQPRNAEQRAPDRKVLPRAKGSSDLRASASRRDLDAVRRV